jgi:hypothetical protein
MIASLLQKYLEILFLVSLACLSGWLGLITASPRVVKSKIIVPLAPSQLADRSSHLSLWNGETTNLERVENGVLVREKGSHGFDCQYYCPREPNTEALIQLRFPVREANPITLALFSLRIHSFHDFDPEARVILSVATRDDLRDEKVLAEFSSFTEESNIGSAFDVTEYVKHKTDLIILVRGKCRRMLYHPTPNDPIGYAGAQLLRQREDEPWAAKLDLWYAKQN